MTIRAGVSGHFKLETHSAVTGELRKCIEFDNLITNTGMDAMMTGWFSTQYFAVGTGTTPPTFTDTTLSNQLVYAGSDASNISDSNSGSPLYYGQRISWHRFNPGQATGNITEVGVGGELTTSPTKVVCSARALIVDGSGNPIALTVLPDEYLTVTYTRRFYPPLTDSTGSFTIGGDTYNYTARLGYAQYVDALTLFAPTSPGNIMWITVAPTSTVTFGPMTGTFSGGTLLSESGAAGGSVTGLTYVAGSFQRAWNIVIPLAAANHASGIIAFIPRLQSSAINSNYTNFPVRYLLDRPIMKTSSQTLTFTLRLQAYRHTP